MLFLLAGLDSDKVEEYFRIVEVTKALDYVYIEAAIKYLDGNFTEEETVNWLIKYKLDSKEKARRRLKFIQQYRSYVINLYVGYNIVKNYIESTGGTPDNNELLWKLFKELISSPLTPSDLIKATEKGSD